ncbi:MAG: hypothetical protein HY319_09460 [Armatimonadetes bacterium]|nr:hypothetical protein [Armatimonadota bacterium]
MKGARSSETVRRSVALPRRLLEELAAVTPPELKGNFNRLVHELLREFIDRQRRNEFEEDMEQMGRDPEILDETAAMCRDFDIALLDGLGHP